LSTRAALCVPIGNKRARPEICIGRLIKGQRLVFISETDRMNHDLRDPINFYGFLEDPAHGRIRLESVDLSRVARHEDRMVPAVCSDVQENSAPRNIPQKISSGFSAAPYISPLRSCMSLVLPSSTVPKKSVVNARSIW